jgi:hypothetical protein
MQQNIEFIRIPQHFTGFHLLNNFVQCERGADYEGGKEKNQKMSHGNGLK